MDTPEDAKITKVIVDDVWSFSDSPTFTVKEKIRPGRPVHASGPALHGAGPLAWPNPAAPVTRSDHRVTVILDRSPVSGGRMGSHGKPDSEDTGKGSPSEHDGQRGPTHGGGGQKTGGDKK
ncbi:hypothetical protein HNR23_002953 [Nocardiopsis mwathae]|uniref:Uncharacterized protein n=1 Tax=Nocardiopsis mwathae TaxID=1472723 RepID=A0A7X0D632_9ACTN|nr:hypothetical protein [Nocardiopsis mwathae]MBB6172893.1 hypothetical protein [Nocardiopsis mwathae]